MEESKGEGESRETGHGGDRRGNDAPSCLKTSVYFAEPAQLSFSSLGHGASDGEVMKGSCKEREGGVADGNVGPGWSL